MIIKVCGMKNAANIVAVSSLDIDWMGFIFYDRSPRSIANNVVFSVNSALNIHPEIKRVGVFVNENEEDILGKCLDFNLNIVQLHGFESPEFCKSLLNKGLEVVKAFQIEDEADLQACKDYEGCASYFLFDTKCKTFGGSGEKFDWNILSLYEGETPFILSGGIDIESLTELQDFHNSKWIGVDLNSKFETEPGFKDIGKLSDFITHFRETIKN